MKIPMLLLSMALLISCGLQKEPGYSPPPIGRLTAVNDGTFSDSKYGIYCELGMFSRDGGSTCESGCGPTEKLERFCSMSGEIFFIDSLGPRIVYASVDLGACSRIIRTSEQAPDTTQPVWMCDDATMIPIADFFAQPGRFYLATNATDYDLP